MNLEAAQHLLPDVANDMVGIIGLSATVQTIEVLGGVSIDFPVCTDTPLPPLIEQHREELGDDVLNKLSAYFAGEKVYIPRCEAALRYVRNQRFINEVATMSEDGYTTTAAVMQLCSKYKISDRTAWKILAKDQSPKVQKSLF